MLHAIEKNKTRYYRRYLGKRDGLEIRVCEEDEITSTVFGTLELIDLKYAFEFWCEVFRLEHRSLKYPSEPPNNCKFEFWPMKNMRIPIPDAHFTFFWADGTRLDLLIETKWNARLSGKEQLHLQWQNYLDDDERNNCWHLFIAPEISAGLNARNNSERGNIWCVDGGERLVLLSWAQILDVLLKFHDRSDGLGRWAKLSSIFLEKIGVSRFKGFTQTHRTLPTTEVSFQSFYCGSNHGFKGFRNSISADQKLMNSEPLFQSFFKDKCNE